MQDRRRDLALTPDYQALKYTPGKNEPPKTLGSVSKSYLRFPSQNFPAKAKMVLVC